MDSLRGKLRGKVRAANARYGWAAGGEVFFWLAVGGPAGERWMRADISSGEATEAFDHEAFAAAFSKRSGKRTSIEQLKISALGFEAPGEEPWVLVAGQSEALRLRSAARLEAKPLPEVPSLRLPPAGPRARSQDRGAAVSILFVNASSVPLQAEWINASGEARGYAKLQPGQQSAQGTYAKHLWRLVDAEGTIYARGYARMGGGALIGSGPLPPTEQRAMGGRPVGAAKRIRLAVREHNVVRIGRDGREKALTEDGTRADGFGGRILYGDKRRFAAIFRTQRPASDRDLHRIDPMPEGKSHEPKLLRQRYRKPGDALPVRTPWIFNLRSGEAQPVEDPRLEKLWTLDRIRTDPEGRGFTFRAVERGAQAVWVLRVAFKDGSVTTLLEERAETFIDHTQKTVLHWFQEREAFLWASERSGHNHLELRSAEDGSLIRQLTSGPWVVRSLERVDEERARILISRLGHDPTQDPYHRHYAWVDLDSGKITPLTEGDGHHSLDWAPDAKSYVATRERVDLPPVKSLHRAADGEQLARVGEADPAELLASGWRPPERFVAPGRDGETPIHGLIYRPLAFDPRLSYPILEMIYAGPHGFHVPKQWAVGPSSERWAEAGFVVVRIDGMGTNWRSKAFHDRCWRDIADAGFPDRKLWIRAAAKSRPWMDLERVGIMGTSAGGQNAMRALIDHADLYRVAVADCGCHDNRMDKIWWNEAWMGYPIGPWYEDSSNLVHAHRTQGDLMLVLGGLDRNVDPTSTLAVVDALIRADKDFAFVHVPRGGHGAMGSGWAQRQVRRFLFTKLGGPVER